MREYFKQKAVKEALEEKEEQPALKAQSKPNANAAAARRHLRSLPCAELVGFHSAPRLQTHLRPSGIGA